MKNDLRRWLRLVEASQGPLSSGQVSSGQAVALIAADDALFALIGAFQNDPASFQADPSGVARLLAIMRRITPRDHAVSVNPYGIHLPALYRGENVSAMAGGRTGRGFHSWTTDPQTASIFASFHGDAGVMVRLTKQVQGFGFDDLARTRMRLRPGSSHYGNAEDEWLVVDPPPERIKVIHNYQRFAPR